MQTANNALMLERLRFAWAQQGRTLLHIEQLHLVPGDTVLLRGRSGSGKSTLLSLIAGILRAKHGRIAVAGQDITSLGQAQIDQFRADRISIIFQMLNLLPYLSVRDNVLLPCRISRERRERAGGTARAVTRMADELLSRLGMDEPDIAERPARLLSIGQQQRVAAARALIGAPALILADEPSSALDPQTRDVFMTLLIEECARHGSALLMVSHDPAVARHFQRSLDLEAINRAAA